MSEQQFKRMEDMLSQLIGMVAKTNERLDMNTAELRTDMNTMRSALKTDIGELRAELKTDIGELRSDMESMRTENDQRHQEVMQKFSSFEMDQDYTWGKVIRNEREIAKVKEKLFDS